MREFFENCGNIKDSMEMFLFMEDCLHALINVISSRIHMKKIAANVNSAIDDWSSSLIDKKTRAIMMRYARIGRIITVSQLTIALTALMLYFISVIIVDKQQVCMSRLYSNNFPITFFIILILL